jgi:hypothetical protein
VSPAPPRPGPARATDDGARRQRLLAQRLAGPPGREVADLVRHLVGVQAQDAPASRLALRPRSAGLTAAMVREACDRERSVVRTWAMRGTLHMVAADDLRWLLALLGGRFAARLAGRRRALGLTDALAQRAMRAARSALADGPLTRPALLEAVAARGVSLGPDPQAGAHLVALGALEGDLVRGPDTERDEPTLVLLDDWLPPAGRAPGDPLAELALRYLAAHGPARVEDLAAWAGLPIGDARRAFGRIAGRIEEAAAPGARGWRLRGAADVEPESAPHVRLLGHFDGLLLGYRDRALTLPPRFARQVQRGGGFLLPVAVVDGRAVGTWRQERRGGGALAVVVQPFAGLDPRALPGLEAEARDVGRFLERKAVFEPPDAGAPGGG